MVEVAETELEGLRAQAAAAATAQATAEQAMKLLADLQKQMNDMQEVKAQEEEIRAIKDASKAAKKAAKAESKATSGGESDSSDGEGSKKSAKLLRKALRAIEADTKAKLIPAEKTLMQLLAESAKEKSNLKEVDASRTRFDDGYARFSGTTEEEMPAYIQKLVTAAPRLTVSLPHATDPLDLANWPTLQLTSLLVDTLRGFFDDWGLSFACLLPKFKADGELDLESEPVSLLALKTLHTIKVSEVVQAAKWFQTKAFRGALACRTLYRVLMQTCTAEFQQHLKDKMAYHKAATEGDASLVDNGVLLLYYFLDTLVVVGSKARTHIKQKLFELKLSDYMDRPMELMKIISAGITFVEDGGERVENKAQLLFTCLQTCTHQQFVTALEMEARLANDKVAPPPGDETSMTYEALMKFFHDKYNFMVKNGSWTPSTVPSGASFHTEHFPGSQMQFGSGQSGRGGGQSGRGGRGGRGGGQSGRGRGGGGRGRGGGGGNGANLFAAPAPGASEEKTILDKLHLYCRECTYWFPPGNPDKHVTAGHTADNARAPHASGRGASGGGGGGRHRGTRGSGRGGGATSGDSGSSAPQTSAAFLVTAPPNHSFW